MIPVRTEGCTSTIEPTTSARTTGWTCDGTGLAQLYRAKIGERWLPVVVPERHVAEVMRDPWAKDLYRPEPYAQAGDHLHLCLGEP